MESIKEAFNAITAKTKKDKVNLSVKYFNKEFNSFYGEILIS